MNARNKYDKQNNYFVAMYKYVPQTLFEFYMFHFMFLLHANFLFYFDINHKIK